QAAPPLPQIVLDATSIDPGHAFECSQPSYLPPRRVRADRVTTGGGGQGRTADRLYFYPPSERPPAGEELYTHLQEEVVGEVVYSVQLKTSSDRATAGGVAKPLWVVLNLLSSGVPLALIPGMLGVTDEVMHKLIVLFSDMPDDVANQVANAFASDDC